jgi:hypothetical protein
MVNRRKFGTILISIMLFGLVNFIYDVGMKSIKNSIDIGPILFGCITSVFSIVIFRYYYNRISNISTNQEISSMKNAAILIDNNRIVLDMNETMLDTFKLKIDDLKGCCISDMANDIFVSIDIILDGIVRMNTILIDIGNTRKHYKINTSNVNDKKLKRVGKLITFIDITDVEIDPIRLNHKTKKITHEEIVYLDPLKEEVERSEFLEILG